VKLTTHLLLLPKLRMRGAVPLLPLYALMAWTGTTSPLPPVEATMFYALQFIYQHAPHRVY
jgi:hypothetical protein